MDRFKTITAILANIATVIREGEHTDEHTGSPLRCDIINGNHGNGNVGANLCVRPHYVFAPLRVLRYGCSAYIGGLRSSSTPSGVAGERCPPYPVLRLRLARGYPDETPSGVKKTL
jgi:hypothetical protein